MDDALSIRRRRARGLAGVTGALTALGLVLLATSLTQQLLALLLVALVALAAFRPRALPLLIGTGVVGAAFVLLGQGVVGRWLLLPVVVGLVATTELLGGVARMVGPVSRTTGGEFAVAGRHAAVAGATYAGVLFVGDPVVLPGPLAMIVVLAALAVLVWALLRR